MKQGRGVGSAGGLVNLGRVLGRASGGGTFSWNKPLSLAGTEEGKGALGWETQVQTQVQGRPAGWRGACEG